MKLPVILTLLLILTACASGGRSSDCNYRNLIGKSLYSADLDPIRASGKEIRLLYPDSFLGFQKDPNRVNVIRDQSDEILAVTCG